MEPEKPEKPDKLTKAATVLLEHMKENRNFLTPSEATTAFNAVRELRVQGYIVPGACSGGLYDGMDGFIVLPKRIKPVKKEVVVARPPEPAPKPVLKLVKERKSHGRIRA